MTNESSKPDAPQYLTNHWSKEMDSASPQRPTCDCFRTHSVSHYCNGRNMKELALHSEVQDENAPGWIRLLELTEQAAEDQREEFAPARDMSAEEWMQVVTLPPTIAKLKSVKDFRLYGSSLVRIPPEIGEMTGLEKFTPYTSYRLHWFPYEITKCRKLKESTVSTRALYGNYKTKPPFPLLPQPLPELMPKQCSICEGAFTGSGPVQVWVSLGVATDVLPLLVHACSVSCLSQLPKTPKGYVVGTHCGGVKLEQPTTDLGMGKFIRKRLKERLGENPSDPQCRKQALLEAVSSAAIENLLELVKELIAEGADVSSSVDPLISACENFNLRMAKFLIAKGSGINAHSVDTGETPLIAAASVGFVEGVRLLLEKGADPSLRDRGGQKLDAISRAEMGPIEDPFFGEISDEARQAFAEVIRILKEHIASNEN